jgi:hypothetical protein
MSLIGGHFLPIVPMATGGKSVTEDNGTLKLTYLSHFKSYLHEIWRSDAMNIDEYNDTVRIVK